MNIGNLKIGQRLMLGFGLVITILLCLATLAYVQVSALSEDISLTIGNRYPKTVLVQKVKDELNQTARSMRNLLLMTDAGAIKQEVASIEQASTVINDVLAQLDKSVTTAKGQEVLKETKNARVLFLSQKATFLGFLNEGKKNEALAFLMKELRPSQLAYMKTLENFVQYQSGLMESSGKEAAERAHDTRMLLIAISLLGTVLSIVLAVLTTRSITRPLGEAVTLAQTVASGDLTSRISSSARDETGQLINALKDMNESLAKVVGEVRVGTDTIATASGQIASGNQDLSARTEEQASSLEETAASMEELTGTVKQNADNARQANQLAISASEVAVKGGGVVAQVVDTMASINASSKKIVDIISVIDGIAFQTNILALNAAVEAARAGEQGRGFAVVASEVRSLAQRSAAAAKEIKGLIDDSVGKVDVGSALVGQAGETMQEIVGSIKRVTDIMGEIAAASQEQTKGIEQVNEAITQMDQVTQQNAALVEEAAAAAQSMQEQASGLVQAVGVFKLNADTQANRVISQARAASKAERPQVATSKPAARTSSKADPVRRKSTEPAPQPAMAGATSGDWTEF